MFIHYHPSFPCFLTSSVTLTSSYDVIDICASKSENIFLKRNFGCIRTEMKEMHWFSVLKSSHSQSPYFVLHLHPKCTSNWSFNSKLCTVINCQTKINWSWSLSITFVNKVNIQKQNYPSLVFIWLVPLTSFSSTELIDCNFIVSMLRISMYKICAIYSAFWGFIYPCIFQIMSIHVPVAPWNFFETNCFICPKSIFCDWTLKN